jgi:hypothetical protein
MWFLLKMEISLLILHIYNPPGPPSRKHEMLWTPNPVWKESFYEKSSFSTCYHEATSLWLYILYLGLCSASTKEMWECLELKGAALRIKLFGAPEEPGVLNSSCSM